MKARNPKAARKTSQSKGPVKSVEEKEQPHTGQRLAFRSRKLWQSGQRQGKGGLGLQDRALFQAHSLDGLGLFEVSGKHIRQARARGKFNRWPWGRGLAP